MKKEKEWMKDERESIYIKKEKYNYIPIMT